MLHDPQLETIWTTLTERLRIAIPDHVFRVWLEPLKAVALSEGVLYVQTPKQTRDWIQRRFGMLLLRTLLSVDASLQRVELVIEVDAVRHLGPSSRSRTRSPKPTYRFEEFVIGAGNRFAHAAALAAAELPGQAYNPLFLHGPTGVGKSHLLNAIGNYTSANDKDLTVVYATGETFTNDFTSAIRGGDTELFKKRYRRADLLLLDDVQFIESKPRTGEELLHTFDALVAEGAQIVLTADRPPAAMPALDSRFRDRLESGLVVDLQLPDLKTRLSIIRMRARRWDIAGDELASLERLANRVHSSIHALEGALIRVRAYASLTQQPITSQLVDHVLSNLYESSSPGSTPSCRLSVEDIQGTTSSLLQLDKADLNSNKRSRQVVYARQVAMYLCRELTDLSLPAIGQRFGGRDHTTVLHAHRQVRARLLSDETTRSLVDRILSKLGATPSRER